MRVSYDNATINTIVLITRRNTVDSSLTVRAPFMGKFLKVTQVHDTK